MDSKKLGVLFVIIAALFWALQPILVKRSPIHPLPFVCWTSIIASAIALVYTLMRKKSLAVRANKTAFIYNAIAGVVLGDLIYTFAMKQNPVLNSVLIGHIQPIFIVIIGFALLKQDKLTRFDYIGIATMLFAALLVSTRTMGNLAIFHFGTMGDILVLCSAFLWATTTIVARRWLGGMEPSALVAWRYGIAGIVFLVALIVSGTFILPDWFSIGSGAIVGVGMIFYYEALRRLKAAQTSALELTSPFFAAILGFILLGETVAVLQFVGFALLIVGVFCLSRREVDTEVKAS